MTDADLPWQTESGLEVRLEPGQRCSCNAELWLQPFECTVVDCVSCQTPLTSRGRSELWPACRLLPYKHCQAVQSQWNVPSCGLTGTSWSWHGPADVDALQVSQRKPLKNLGDCRQVHTLYCSSPEWPILCWCGRCTLLTHSPLYFTPALKMSPSEFHNAGWAQKLMMALPVCVKSFTTIV